MSTISPRYDSTPSSTPTSTPQTTPTTDLLAAWSGGDVEAFERVLPRLYDDLCRVASRSLAEERGGHTLETRALVHEAYLRLRRQERTLWSSRAHFFAVAARTMRRILIDHARRRLYDKRGGGAPVVSLDDSLDVVAGPASTRDTELLELDRALDELRREDEQLGSLVELRYFGGLTVQETAEALALSVPTVVRRWRIARSWLFERLRTGA